MKNLLRLIPGLCLVAGPLMAQPTPKDPKSPMPGHVDGRGPTGPVELKIVSPKPGEVIPLAAPEASADGKRTAPPQGADVSVRFEIKNYETFQDKDTQTGQHIHIILDNNPYLAHYDATKAWVFKHVPKGTHTIRAFPSRPWHESIKEPAAFAMVTFHVGEKDGNNTPDPALPLLTYSRPKGAYPKSMAAKILFDFYVTGCRLSAEEAPDACQVRYRVDDKPEVTLTKWEPIWWENVAPGKHAYVIGLSRNGKMLAGPGQPFNLAKGFFEIENDKPAGPPAAPKGPGPGGNEPEKKHDH